MGVVGVTAKAAHSGGALFSSSATRGGTIQEAQTWEELPGIDKVIRSLAKFWLALRTLNFLGLLHEL